jgi:hypothetical protein
LDAKVVEVCEGFSKLRFDLLCRQGAVFSRPSLPVTGIDGCLPERLCESLTLLWRKPRPSFAHGIDEGLVELVAVSISFEVLESSRQTALELGHCRGELPRESRLL